MKRGGGEKRKVKSTPYFLSTGGVKRGKKGWGFLKFGGKRRKKRISLSTFYVDHQGEISFRRKKGVVRANQQPPIVGWREKRRRNSFRFGREKRRDMRTERKGKRGRRLESKIFLKREKRRGD